MAGNRVAAVIDEGDVVTLAGNRHPLARVEDDLGSIEPGARLERMVLLLQPSSMQQQRLDALTEAQQDPKSPLFRQWLTPEQYGEHFGASSQDAARIAGWLVNQGFAVEAPSAGRRLLIFSGTAEQVEATFHTQIHNYQVAGRRHIANSDDPQIPRALASVVAGIVSLHDFRRASEAHMVKAIADPASARAEAAYAEVASAEKARSDSSNPDNTEGTAHYLFPADFATIYDLDPLYAAKDNGYNTAIAIVGRSNINVGDVTSFRGYAGLPVNPPSVILDGANPGLVAGDQAEATLDVEWAGGVAPYAKVKLVVAKSTATSDGVDLAAQYIVNNKTALVMSTSFGSCEAHMGAAEIAFYNALWQQAAAEGISAFVSAGDSGASGCDAGSATTGTGAQVNGLCTSPYVTCVGGTEFNEGSASSKYWGTANGAGGDSAVSYIPEAVWNESKSNGGSGLWASGGGISQVFTQPSWQKSVAGANSNGMRAVPDVALNAASHDGYLVALNGSWYDFSGTSAASPSFAAIMALLVQKESGVGQGNANPGLYAMLSASADPFHRTLNGNNSVPGVGGFTASGAAYNLATGLGSVDADVLVTNWLSANKAAQPAFTIKPSLGSLTLLSGKSATFTVAVAGGGGFAGRVSLTASNLPAGVVVAFSPAVVAAGATSTVIVTATNSSITSVGSMLLSGTSGSLQATAALNLTVQMPASLSVAVASNKLSIVQGKTVTLAVTANTAGIYSGTVALSVAGLPKGVTAAWSASMFKASGAGSFQGKLTLTASATTTVASTTLTIGAAGDGLTAQITPALIVTAAPAVNLVLSSAAIKMTSTGTGQIVVTASPVGGIKPQASLAGVTFQATGVPVGVTSAWSKAALTKAGAVQATLTLTGSKKAIAGSAKLVVKAGLIDAVSKVAYAASLPATLTVAASK